MINRILRWLLRIWWKPVTDGKKWGIYHPTAYHSWGYPFETRAEAAEECRKRNR
jgi:hypothetical protein